MSEAQAARRAARRREILEAAERVFARAGYWSATTVEVAQQVGLTQAALYRYFDSKRALFIETLGFRQQEIIAVYGDAMKQPGRALDRIRALSLALIDLTATHPDMGRLRVQATAVAADDEELREAVVGTLRVLVAAHEDLLKQGQADGSVRAEVDPHAAASTIAGLAYLYYVGLALGYEGAEREAAQATLRGYLGTLAAD